MHFEPSGINCRPCIILHLAKKKNSCQPVVSITRCACPAGMHVFISSATSGSAMKIAWAFTRCSPVKASTQRLHIKIFIVWSFREFHGLIFPLMGSWCLILVTLKTNSKHWCTEKPWPNPVERYHILQGFRRYPKLGSPPGDLNWRNGFLIKNLCFLKFWCVY